MTAGDAVRMRGVRRRFGDVEALRGADLTLAAGEIHALLGENGAGKTTLMNVLFGLLRADSGTVEIAAGPVGMVHQHFSQVPTMTVAENVWLGRPGLRFDRRAAADAVRRVGSETGLSLDPAARAEALPAGLRQRLEIVKALARDVKVLLLDEPTAALTPREVDELFAALRRLAARGIAVVLITHKLREVTAVASRVTVLRRGETVLTGDASAYSHQALAAAMIGDAADTAALAAALDTPAPRTVISTAPPALVMRGERAALEVRHGEIVGIAAVEGNGQRELMRAIVGLTSWKGELSLAGRPGFVPEDRQHEGLVLDFSIAENLWLGDATQFWMPPGEVARRAGLAADEYDVRASGVWQPVRALSGGNQQKVVLARVLGRQPGLIVAENPTRGLDVRATAELHRRLRQAADGGAGVLFYSTDLDEVIALADRIGVMVNNEWRWVPHDERTRERVGALMLGSAA